MEKTLAREIYKRMEIGKQYTTMELFNLLSESEYYGLIPAEMQGKDVRKVVAAEMWKVIRAGYATTHTSCESLPNVRGLRYGSKPSSFTTYTIRYWIRKT